MSKQRRQFSPEEKYSILQESEREGHTETCRKYNLASSVLAYWKKK
jgi:putative transposase